MKSDGRAVGAHDGEIRRQERVQRFGGALGRGPADDLDRGDVPVRMDAGVGAPCDHELLVGAVQRLERASEHPLDRPLAGLARPAAEAGAVVGER